MKALAEELCARNEVGKADRSNWDSLAQDVAAYCQPRKANITKQTTPGLNGETDDIYNQTAMRAAATLAAGSMSWAMDGKWFKYEPPDDRKEDDELKTWYQKATEYMYREFERSNLYTEAHEMFLDRGTAPCALLYVEEGKRSLFNFKAENFGTYWIAEDDEGIVDTVFREFQLTNRQAVQKFGIEYVSEDVQKAMADGEPKRKDEKRTFLHAVFPRIDAKQGMMDDENKPIASVYVDLKAKHVCRNSGYDEMPAMVTRFLKWGDGPYGYCPGFEALPTIRQVNFIEKNMDVLGEKAAFPPMLVPSYIEGDIDPRSNGITTFDPNLAGGAHGLPQTWGTEGKYDIGLERIKTKDDIIKEAFLVTIFQMFQQIEAGKLTAYEASLRESERLPQFSPTFRRLMPEIIQPLLMRCFAIAYRAGRLGEAPDSAFQEVAPGVNALSVPQITLTGKMALALKAHENNALLNLLQLWSGPMQVQPDIIDNWDLDTAARDSGDNYGIPADWKRPMDEVDEMREQRAQAALEQQQAQMGAMAAKAAKDISGSDDETKEMIGMK